MAMPATSTFEIRAAENERATGAAEIYAKDDAAGSQRLPGRPEGALSTLRGAEDGSLSVVEQR